MRRIAVLLAVALLCSCTVPMTSGLTKDGLRIKQVFNPGLSVLPAADTLLTERGERAERLFEGDSVAIFAVRSVNKGSEPDSIVRLWGYQGAQVVAREKGYRYLAILYGETGLEEYGSNSWQTGPNGTMTHAGGTTYYVDYRTHALMFDDPALIDKIRSNFHTLVIWDVEKLDLAKRTYPDTKANLIGGIAWAIGVLVIVTIAN